MFITREKMKKNKQGVFIILFFPASVFFRLFSFRPSFVAGFTETIIALQLTSSLPDCFNKLNSVNKRLVRSLRPLIYQQIRDRDRGELSSLFLLAIYSYVQWQGNLICCNLFSTTVLVRHLYICGDSLRIYFFLS